MGGGRDDLALGAGFSPGCTRVYMNLYEFCHIRKSQGEMDEFFEDVLATKHEILIIHVPVFQKPCHKKKPSNIFLLQKQTPISQGGFSWPSSRSTT